MKIGLVHICFVCSEYPPAPHGGIGSFTQTLARALVERGHRVTAIGMYPDRFAGSEEDQGVRVIRISRRGPPVLRFLSNRRKLADALQELHGEAPIDIIEGGELDIAVLNRNTPGQKILRMHGGPHFFATGPRPNIVAGRKERWAFHMADHLCAVSHYVADTTRRLLHLGNRAITVIPNPVDIETFAPAVDDREEEGLITFVGTITERKGIRQLVQAMPEVVAQAPVAHLEVYGGDEIDSKGVSFTQTLANSVPAELKGKIEWKGRVARSLLPDILRRASVCVYPSHMEAMPIAWLEGLAAGKAVVASQTGPGPEVIEDGVTGILCNPHDPASIAEKILEALHDEPLRRHLGSNARKRVVERYSLEKLVERNIEYYRQTIAGGRQ